VKKPRTDKRVFDILASRDGAAEWRVVALSADATLLDLHLTLLGAFEWNGDYARVERAYRFNIGDEHYEDGRGSRTALRRLLADGTLLSYACDQSGVAMQCEVVRCYEVPSRRHYPKVLEADDERAIQAATRRAQSSMRREYLAAREPSAPFRDAPPASRGYRHGFFTAVISGPLVPPTEWLGAFVGASSHDSIDALNAQLGEVFSTYDEIASELHERPDDFIERVASLCAEGTRGEAMVDWYRGYLDAIALRPVEWKAFIDDPGTDDLFAPLSALQDIVNSPTKREWLADEKLRGNLARALGILGVRVWEMWRERLFPQA
jgi:yecA family protein